MKAYTQQNVLNTITTNTFSVIEDLSLNGRILVSGDASLNGRLFVGGNVGIGTTSPTQLLDITNTTGSANIRLCSLASAGYITSSYNAGVNSYVGIQSSVNTTSALGTPQFVVSNNGYVGIGTTNPQVALSVVGYVYTNGIAASGYNSAVSYFGGNYNNSINSPAIYINSPDTYNRYAVTFGTGGIASGTSTFTNGTIYGSITTNGSATQFNTSSDYRLKENVVDLSNGLYVVTKLKPRQFNFIECPDAIQNGFIAHEVQEFVPNAVINNKDEVDASGNMVIQQLDASKLIPFLVGAIQDLQAQLADVMARLSNAGIA